MFTFKILTSIALILVFPSPLDFLTPSNICSASTQIKGISELQKEYSELFSGYRNATQPSTKLPNLNAIKKLCSRDEFFYSYNPLHMEAVAALRSIFEETETPTEFFRVARLMRDREEIHPKVWYHAITKYTNDSPQLRRLQKLTPLEAMPDIFINSGTLDKARKLEREGVPVEQCVPVDETYGLDNRYENKLWYMREDMLLNAHHWFWHMFYPMHPSVKPERSGELFYFIHHYLQSRYNTERFTNLMSAVSPFNIGKDVPIEEGYSSHLKDAISGRSYTDRAPNTKFTDVINVANAPLSHEGKPIVEVYVEELMVVNRDRIIEAIDSGYLIDKNGNHYNLNNAEGIDILCDALQASNYSVYPEYYGSFGVHNNGHVVFGRAGDPDLLLNLPPGVMLESGTAMRDPIFYRWHETVGNIFDRHKQQLLPYTPTGGDYPLIWSGISVQKISVQLDSNVEGTEANKLKTFWNQKKFPLSRGLDFTRPQGSSPVSICSKHLDHEDFTYTFVIEREAKVQTNSATIRVFLAPRFDENGERFWMEDQRSYFFLVDLFRTKLKVGENIVTRRSVESSLTIPWTQGLYELEQTPQTNDEVRVPVSFPVPYCGCGYPHHLLLPKGTTQGVQFDLFVMVTNGEEDYVEGSSEYFASTRPAKEFCQSAPILCGLPDEKYPDAKPMNYPFDRVPYTVVTKDDEERTAATLEEYVASIPNIGIAQVVIVHDEKFAFQP